MGQYRKRPIVVEATQWHCNGDHPLDACYPITSDEGTCFMSEGKIVRYYHPDGDSHRKCTNCESKMYEHGYIDMAENGRIVCPGDWVIKGLIDGYDTCKPEVFALEYERVKE